jgi:hypothetical protein
VTNTPDKSEMKALERVERRLNNAWAKHGFMTLTVSDLREVVSLARAPSRPADQVPDRDGLAESLKARLASRYNATSNTIPVSRTEVERIIAALKAVPAASEVGWQPIESAPKDGSYIIAAKFGHSQDLAWVKHSRWITAGEIADLEGGEPDEYDPGWTDGDDDSEPCFPTHWMPLGPPALKASGEE